MKLYIIHTSDMFKYTALRNASYHKCGTLWCEVYLSADDALSLQLNGVRCKEWK